MSTRYRVHGSISTRKSTDPESEDFETWLDWHDGDELTGAPAHLPIAEYVKSGHLTRIGKKEAADGEA